MSSSRAVGQAVTACGKTSGGFWEPLDSYIEAAERLLEFETSKAIEPLPPKRRVKRLPTCEASALTPQALRGPGSAWPESPPLTADQQKALADIAAAVEHDERRRVSWEVAREGALSGGEV